MRAHRRRDWIGNIWTKVFQRPSDNAPEPARGKLALASRFVDRDNPSNFERGGGLFFSLVRATFFVNVAKNLKLWLHDLQMAVAVFFHLAVEGYHLPRLKAVLQIGGIEPQTFQLGAPLADHKLKNGHAA